MKTKEQNTTTTARRPATGARKAGRGFRISAGATIGRPVGEGEDLAGEYENDPLWRSGVVEMHYETPGGPRPGARTREVMRLLGGRATTVAEIVEFERDRRTAFESRGAPVPVWGSRTFEPVGDSTRFTYELSARPGGPWALLSPVLATVLRRRAARDLKKLKTLLERGGPGSGAADGKEDESGTGRVGIMQNDVQIVSDVYEAFGRGDVPAIFGRFHPEAEVYQSSRLPWGGEFRGHEELGVFLAKLTGAIESEVETGQFIDDGEGHVVQMGRTRGTVRETGARFDVPETHVWTIEDGKVKRFESYVDAAKMRAALGL